MQQKASAHQCLGLIKWLDVSIGGQLIGHQLLLMLCQCWASSANIALAHQAVDAGLLSLSICGTSTGPILQNSDPSLGQFWALRFADVC